MQFSPSALEEDQDAIFPIRIVSEETGVNSVTLRAWERRYGFIKPQRTPKGHRLYSRRDIELIKQVVELLENGSSLTAVRAVLTEGEAPVQFNSLSADEPWKEYIQKMQVAITHFNEGRVDALYNKVMSLYPAHLVMTKVLLPLLKQLGQRWQEGAGTVAEEHFFGVFLRNKLGARLHHSNNPPRGPHLVAACMPAEYHDFGLLIFALIAREHGFRLVLLGANTPLGELVEVASRCGSDAIVLSATGAIESDVLEQLRLLTESSPVPVMVGGAGVLGVESNLEQVGAVVVGSELVQGVRAIFQQLSDKEPKE